MHSNLHILTFLQHVWYLLVSFIYSNLSFFFSSFFSSSAVDKVQGARGLSVCVPVLRVGAEELKWREPRGNCRSWASFGWLKPKIWLDQSEKEPPLSCISLRLCCQHWLNPKEFFFIILSIPNTLLYPSCFHPLVAKYLSSKLRHTKYKDIIFIPHMCRCSFQQISLPVLHDVYHGGQTSCAEDL